MPRRQDAPWVVLGMPEKNKILLSGKGKMSKYETLICERDVESGEPKYVHMQLMWCNRDAVIAFRDHLNNLISMWEEYVKFGRATVPDYARKDDKCETGETT